MAAGAIPATVWVHHCSCSLGRSQQGRGAEVAGTSCTSRPGLPLIVLSLEKTVILIVYNVRTLKSAC